MTGGASNRAEEVVLVRAIAGGSEDALAALYDRHADGVFAAALRLSSDRQLAEEVVQETFLALWNRAELYDPAAGSLEAWLFTIARNRTVDRLRAAGRRPRLIALSSAAAPDEPEGVTLERLAASGEVLGGAQVDAGPELALDRVEIRQAIRDALAAIGDEERTVILLAYRNGLDAVGDRRAARLASRNGEDQDEAGAPSSARGACGGAWPGSRPRARINSGR